MKSIVKIYLGHDRATRRACQDGRFLVVSDQPGRSGIYEDEPAVIAQLAPDEDEAKFEAEWKDGQWVFGRRFADA